MELLTVTTDVTVGGREHCCGSNNATSDSAKSNHWERSVAQRQKTPGVCISGAMYWTTGEELSCYLLQAVQRNKDECTVSHTF